MSRRCVKKSGTRPPSITAIVDALTVDTGAIAVQTGQSVAGVVCDRRSGLPISWDNLFVDKTAGLSRLGDETAARLAAVAPAEHVSAWRRQGHFAPIDVNFKAWNPTSTGIDLHFPEFQFGRGLKVVTIPWSKLADLVRPEFSAIMS